MLSQNYDLVNLFSELRLHSEIKQSFHSSLSIFLYTYQQTKENFNSLKGEGSTYTFNKTFLKFSFYLVQSQSQSVTPSMTRRKMREKKMAAEMK